MIDWGCVGSSALWIFGASIVLAATSYHGWLATERGGRYRDAFVTRPWRMWASLGMVLVGVGWFLGHATSLWHRLASGLAILAFVWLMARSARARRAGGRA